MNTDTYAAKYVPIGYRTLSPDELTARRTAQDLKTASAEAIQIAAPVMAALIDGPCWLVPVPASNGSLTANLALARAIAELVPGAHVKCAIGRAMEWRIGQGWGPGRICRCCYTGNADEKQKANDNMRLCGTDPFTFTGMLGRDLQAVELLGHGTADQVA
jgi:hypothetical protein